jgi:uncharacterized protein (DUF58 family)
MTSHLPRIKAHVSIHAHRKARGLLLGEHASTQVGRSLDFNDLREYVRGDDVRDLDWKASARSGHLLVKRYVATRKHTVLLVVSTGRSMAAVNDRRVPKRELAVLVAGILGWLAVRHGDQVTVAYGDAAARRLRRASGKEVDLERSLGAIHGATTADSAASDLAALLDDVARLVRRRTIMVVICDDPVLDQAAVDALRRARAQHEVLLVTLTDLDPTRESPERLRDIESDGLVPSWASEDLQLADDYAALLVSDASHLRQTLDRLGIAHEVVVDHETALPTIFRLLERHRRGRRL